MLKQHLPVLGQVSVRPVKHLEEAGRTVQRVLPPADTGRRIAPTGSGCSGLGTPDVVRCPRYQLLRPRTTGSQPPKVILVTNKHPNLRPVRRAHTTSLQALQHLCRRLPATQKLEIQRGPESERGQELAGPAGSRRCRDSNCTQCILDGQAAADLGCGPGDVC